MGTTREGVKSYIWLFDGNWKHTRRLSRQDALLAKQPNLQAICFRGQRQLKRKDNAHQGFPLHHQIPVRCQAISLSWLGDINSIPCQDTKQSLHAQSIPISYGRLTHVQTLFTWNPAPLQSSMFPFEYLLLPPRSAPRAASPRLTP